MNINDMTEQAYRNGYAAGAEDSKPKWIPVTERLPDKSIGYCSEEVLMNDRGIILIGWYDYDAREWCADEYFSLDLVDAWMPLPEPYKPEDETS